MPRSRCAAGVFVTEQSVPEELEFDDRDREADHFVALLDGVAVGAGRLTVTGAEPGAGPGRDMKGTGVLGRLAVDKAARGAGLGRLLVHAIEQRAAGRGLGAVELHAQARACGFYEQLGYVPYGDLFTEDGIEHISMRKELSAVGYGDGPGLRRGPGRAVVAGASRSS